MQAMLALLLQALGCVWVAVLGLALLRWLRGRSAASGRRARARGQTAVITGGSSGIGLAIAHRLAARGMKLVLAARRQEPLAAAARELREAGAEVHTIPTDIADAASCEALVAQTVQKHGRLDLFVACAGIGHHGLAADDSTEVQKSLIDVNHFGTVHSIRAALPALLKFSGELFVVGSISGVVGSPLRTAYCASKYATMGYVEALRMELLMLGTPLPISIVMPGSVDTPFRKHNRGPRPKMTAEMCADLAVAGWERGDYRIYCPTHACFMVSIPPLFGQWTMDTFMTSSESNLPCVPSCPSVPFHDRLRHCLLG